MADRVSGPRLRKSWVAIPSINLALVIDGTVLGGSVQFAEPATVLRMLGEYVLMNTGPLTAGDRAKVAVGIGVVSTDAFNLGATAMPDPAGEADYPWLYWAEHQMFTPVGGTIDPNAAGMSLRRSFDIRSMRKMKPRESLAAMVEYGDGAGTPPLQFLFSQTRVLVGT